jgi:hypothetical protein
MHRTLAFVFSTIPLIAWTPLARGSERPNILWIVAEDFGPELACYGTDQVFSPNLDRLASKGVRYTRAYTTAPVCSASRSAFMTRHVSDHDRRPQPPLAPRRRIQASDRRAGDPRPDARSRLLHGYPCQHA